MYFIYLIPVVLIIIFLWVKSIKKEKELMKKSMEIMNAYGTYDENENKLIINDQIYKIVYFKVPRQSELVINSPKIWEVRISSTKRLINQTKLLSTKDKKIVVVYPEVKPIKRYINENEMVFVKHTFFNKMHVIPIDQLDQLLIEVSK